MLKKRKAYFTFDKEAHAYYFAPKKRKKPPYTEQQYVTAVLDIADDGTLAGIELVMERLPPPPKGER